MKRLLLIVLISSGILTTGGCLGRMVKEGVGTARGAKGSYASIMPVAPTKGDPVLAPYREFELGAITDGTGGLLPAEFMSLLEREFPKQLARKKFPTGGGKTLVIRGTVVHYENANTLGTVLGPLEEVIVRTELVDKQTGQILGVANCIGRTDETVNQGVEKKADGLAKAFVNWIAAYYPKTGEESEE